MCFHPLIGLFLLGGVQEAWTEVGLTTTSWGPGAHSQHRGSKTMSLWLPSPRHWDPRSAPGAPSSASGLQTVGPGWSAILHTGRAELCTSYSVSVSAHLGGVHILEVSMYVLTTGPIRQSEVPRLFPGRLGGHLHLGAKAVLSPA